jgi:GDP-6-deoxy-D-talose 4-dehydrogenase
VAFHSETSELWAPARGRVLVTGLSGFTGRYVRVALEGMGYECVGLTQHDGSPVNLTDARAVEDVVDRLHPDHVIHLAAVAFVAHADVSDFYSTNIVGTRNLLAALASAQVGPRSVVVASSANVYGNSREVPLTEASPVAPANDYAVSKLAMEYLARIWLDKLPITIVRPFNYTGVGQSKSFLVPKLVAHFSRRQQEISLGNLDVARDFSDVRVVADVYARLLSEGLAGETYNLCSGTPVSLSELVAELERLTGHRIAINVDRALVRDNEIKTLYGAADKLRERLPGYAPIPIGETLRWMIEST